MCVIRNIALIGRDLIVRGSQGRCRVLSLFLWPALQTCALQREGMKATWKFGFEVSPVFPYLVPGLARYRVPRLEIKA